MHLVYLKEETNLYKILIIEDDEQLRSMYQRLFSLHGYESYALTAGEDVMQTVLKKKPNVILLDIMLPSYTGMSILLSLKKNKLTKDCVVIMLTNVASQEEKEKSYANGAALYLIKNDYDPMQLYSLVHKTVKKLYN